MPEYVHLYRNKYVVQSPVGTRKDNLLEGFVQIYHEVGGQMLPMICEMETRRQSVSGVGFNYSNISKVRGAT